MAKATKKLGTPENPMTVQPAPAVPPQNPDEPTPGVIDPEKNPTTNQPESPTPSSEMPTVATTEDVKDNGNGKGKPATAQEAIERVKEGEFATDDDRQKAMKKWPRLFAETSKD